MIHEVKKAGYKKLRRVLITDITRGKNGKEMITLLGEL